MLQPHYEDDFEYRALQAADILAYEARRLLVRTEYAKHYRSNRAWERLREKVERLYKFDYRTLNIVRERNSPNSISPAIKSGKLTEA